MLYDWTGLAIPPPGMGFIPSRPSRPRPPAPPGQPADAIADRELVADDQEDE